MTQQLARLQAHDVSATELVQETLAAIELRNPELNALVTLRPAAALTEAAHADERIARGESRPLEGIPFSVKDLIATAGVRTTAGSLTLRDYVPSRSATAVQRLQAAGAILIGKSNCSEFGMGNLHTGNRVFGETRNPWSASRTPGGSSGGDSAAVAAGLTSFGVGTDFGGSVRWPAHCTGVVSLRPSAGQIPNTGVLPHSGLADRWAVNSNSFQCWIQTIGPLVRSARDLSLLLQVMSGPDAFDSHAVPVTLPDKHYAAARELACAYFDGDAEDSVRADVRAAVSDAALALRSAGVSVTRNRPPFLEAALDVFHALREADGLEDHRRVAAMCKSDLTPLVRAGLQQSAARSVSLDEYRELVERADQIRAEAARFMEAFPILLMPVGSVPAFVPCAGEFDAVDAPAPRSAFESFCRAISLLRVPAAVVPCGTSDEGLPIGVQVVGRRFHDKEVLAVAQLLEEVFGAWAPPASRHADGR
jgi:Asp-tRNA(Asn)/Glu-tRNA(Gln) amidotransferase A subunit family amidase